MRANGNYVKPIGQKDDQVPFAVFKSYMRKFITSNLRDFCGRDLNQVFAGDQQQSELLTF